MLRKALCYLVCLGMLCANGRAIAQTHQTHTVRTGSPRTISAAQVPQIFYQTAISGDLDQLKALKKQGLNLEQVDANGNTALCLAIIHNNQSAYKALIKAGASTSSKCAKLLYSYKLEPTSQGKMIYLNGGLSETPYGEVAAITPTSTPFWTAGTMVSAGLIAVGAAGVALALSGGGGGGGSSASTPVIPTSPNDITAVEVASCLGGTWVTNGETQECKCPTGKSLINGVCVETKENYNTVSVTNAGAMTVATEDEALTAELGASAVNNGSITGSTTGNTLVGIKVNGFGAGATTGTITPETNLNASAASNGVNNGTIHLTQGSSAGGELYGILAKAGAVASNEATGNITLDIIGNAAGYGMFGEYDSTGLKNNGKINLNLSQNAEKGYGLFARDRNLVNNGDITLTVNNPTYSSAMTGEIAGMKGVSLQNNGTISLKRGEADSSTANASNHNFYGLYSTDEGDPTKKATVENNGSILIDVTKNPYYNYGIYVAAQAQILNKGRIEILGDLSSTDRTGSEGKPLGGAYAIRFIRNYGSITNEGVIETRRYNETTQSYDKLAITGNGYLALLTGEYGSVYNKADLNLYLDNKVASGTEAVWSINAIDLNGPDASGNGITNTANIIMDVGTGSITSGTATAVRSISASVLNNGNVYMTSKTDNLNLTALQIADYNATLTNGQYSIIKIDGSGKNTTLIGMYAPEADIKKPDIPPSINNGSIFITHRSSGSMIGMQGGSNKTSKNTGTIRLIAEPDTDEATTINITGTEAINSGIVDISLRKGSGYNSTTIGARSNNTNNVTITAEDRTQRQLGTIIGAISNSGRITINADTTTKNGETMQAKIIGLSAFNPTNDVTGIIDIKMNGEGLIVGAVGRSGFENADDTEPLIYDMDNKGTISIKATNTTHASYEFDNLESGKTSIPFDVIGMITNSRATNYGTILLDVSGDAKVAGMVAYDGGIAINRGLIEFKGNVNNFVALAAIGSRTIERTKVEEDTQTQEGTETKTKTTTTTKTTQYSTVYNYGRIKVNANEYWSNPTDLVQTKDGGEIAQLEKDKANQTVEKTVTKEVTKTDAAGNTNTTTTTNTSTDDSARVVGTTSNLKVLSRTVRRPTVLLNRGVRYVSESNGAFDAQGTHVMGEVIGGTTLVQSGNRNMYVGAGEGLGAVIGDGDTSDLTLQSASYMFNAFWGKNENNENGVDIVMTRRSFNDLVANKSLAGFLEMNYAAGNGEGFFNMLKNIGTASEFAGTLSDITAKDTFSRFAYEDLTAMREVNFAMNEAMFANDDKPLFETTGSVNGFGFKSDNNSQSQYALATKRVSPRFKVGYAMSNTTLNSDDDNDTTRRNQLFQVFAPIGYERAGVKLISTPQIGFARGHYTRASDGNGSYKGVIEKRTFALMNEARYPMSFGKYEVAPTVEFNAIAYNQKGREDAKAYALTMPSDTNVSIEGGVGLRLSRAAEFGHDSKLSMTAGVMMYREFADPYNIKMGMQGMEGSFELYDERSPYRAVASFGFGYDLGSVNMYGSIQHYMQSDTYTKAKAGFKLGF